jgi:molecular chaperone GrpE
MDERDKPKPTSDRPGPPADEMSGAPGGEGAKRPPGPPDGDIRVVDRRWWAQKDPAETSDAGQVSLKPTYVESLERAIADKDEQLRETISRYREASNQFEEARIRFRREVGKEVERGKRAILVELLDVVDNLDRAIDAADRSQRPSSILQGVEMVRSQFLAKLDGFGVKRVEAAGQRFDPARHEAATVVPTADPEQDGVIVGIVRHGYEIAGEVLRPAVVAVAKLTRD